MQSTKAAAASRKPDTGNVVQHGRRESQVGRIARIIADRISDGTYPLGSRIPSERQLALEFEVSRPVIREALSTVSALDVLDVQMGRGSFVVAVPVDRSPSATANLQDVVNVREVIEIGALRLAAREADRELQDQLRTALSELRQAVEEKAETADLDSALHAAIVAASGSPLLSEMWSGIEQQIAQTIRISPHGRTMSQEILALHEVLANGCLGGNLEEAIEASRRLHQQNREFLRALLG